MSDQNPYSTPDASLASGESAAYDPSIFSFSGRIGRLRYLAYNTAVNLVLTVAMIPVIGVSAFMDGGGDMAATGGMSVISGISVAIFYLFTIVLAIMFGKRRLNDLNRSGWFILLIIIPVVNLVLIIYMLFFRGTDGDNDFGPKAVPNTIGVKILGMSIPVIFLLGILTAIGLPAYQDYVTRAQQSQQ